MTEFCEIPELDVDAWLDDDAVEELATWLRGEGVDLSERFPCPDCGREWNTLHDVSCEGI